MQTLITSLKLENARRGTVNKRTLPAFTKKDGYIASFGSFGLNVPCTGNITIVQETA